MKKAKKVFPSLKKDIQKFLTEEEGKITKKNALYLAAGLITIASAVSGFMRVEDVQAGCISQHWSYARYSDHSRGGWC